MTPEPSPEPAPTPAAMSAASVPYRVAEAVLRGRGADIRTAEPGRGWTNATWLAEDLVVRVARRAGAADLLREERLLRLLPPGTGCPAVVDSGVLEGHEWVLTRRVPGRNLEEVWPTLDPAARSRAVAQMWERARHVHRTDVTAVAPYVRDRSPFFPDGPEQAAAGLARLVAAGALGASVARGLGPVLDRCWAALPQAPRVLNHGDFCPPNTLWHDGRVTALLDFEFAVVAPLAVDLNELVKLAYAPAAQPTDQPTDQPAAQPTAQPGDEPAAEAERAALRAVVEPIAAAELDAAGGPDVLLGHAVLLEMWMLENDLASDDPDPQDRATATALLTAFAEGDGGFYAPLLASRR
ncbi:phosphotransferase [Streptomyces sp. NPDC048290]|uniref:phosphotransferase n=1 Tax=Streptomyces sp. NPDC048290 TaxID=3155811 RepID=UPI003434695E